MAGFGSLLTTTIREFDGGLNVVNDDLNMDTKYSKVETNVYNNIDGTKSKRYGTKYFTDVKKYEIVEEIYDNCEVVTTKMLKIKQPEKKYIPVSNFMVSIVSPEALVGDYLVEFANQEYFEIKIDSTFTGTSVSEITYTYRSETENIAKNCTVSTKSLLKFVYDGYNRLIIGNTLTISDNEALNGEYIVQSLDNEAYYIDVSDKNVTKTQQNVHITHDNRNIKGNRIINGEYFIDKLILVSDLGEIVAIDGVGDAITIWNDTIAKTVNKEGAEGWHKTTSVCFTVFNGVLTVWNGTDKPLAIDFDKFIPCNYLLDEGTGSNANVPIAKYALAFNHYLVAGNIFDELEGKQFPDRLSISSRDTIGTFYSGDFTDIDNDAVVIDLGKIISSNKQSIKGLSRYRNNIAVGFDDVTVFGVLGTYEDAKKEVQGEEVAYKIHVPNFEDVVDSHGCISNRTYMPIQSELVCLDYTGLPMFRRGNFNSMVIPTRISKQIAPELYKQFIGLKENAIEDRIFTVYNPKDNQYLLFIPNNSEYDETTETICYAYTLRNGSNSSARDGAWSKFLGWNFQYGITSALGEVFLGNGTKIYTLGNIDNPYYADFIDDPEYPAQDEEDTSGKAIDFDWEFPWADFGDRAAIKKSRYLALSTTGDSQFYVDMFLDYIYNNIDTGMKDPQLTMDFVGGDSPGWGGGSQLYGAGRRTNTEFLFAWTATFKIAKIRLYGSSKKKININSITLYYQKGNIRR
jgi:hypothetical protein